MSTVREIYFLVKYSPKRENILRRMQENFEGNFDPDTDKFLALDNLCPTQKIIGNYCLLLKLWDN